MRKISTLLLALFAALALPLTACGATITAVHLPEELQVNVGATAETAATYETAKQADEQARQAAADKIDWAWAVEDDTIATVDAHGVVTGVRGGSTTVTITSADGKLTASCPVTVSQPLQGMVLDSIDLVLNRTDTAEISCTLTPADTTDTDIVYAIADSSVAKLDGSKVAAVGNGTTTLTAVCGGIKAAAQITVTTAPTELVLDSTEGILTVGNTHTITATLLPETTTETEILWASSDESLAAVDAHGTVTAVAPGSCVITAATPDGQVKAAYALTVKAKPAATPRPTAAPVQTVPEPAQPEQPAAPVETPAPEPAPTETPEYWGPYDQSYYDEINNHRELYESFGYSSGIDWTQDSSCASSDNRNAGCDFNCD